MFLLQTATNDGVDVAQQATEIATGAFHEFTTMLHLDDLVKYFTWGNLAKVITSLIAILIFWIAYRIIRRLVKKAASKTLEKKTVGIITKAISYCFYVLIVMYILGLFHINLSAIWGAAGIAGVAVGFAAQTSVSNLISGLFVVTDKAMKVGDFIDVGGTSGTVDTIGIISMKLRTLDNQLIRIPNSTIINSTMINYSALPYRRYVFETWVDYDCDYDAALKVAKSVPARCPTVIKDDPNYPSNAVWTTQGDSGLNLNIIVWSKREDFLQTKSDVCVETMKAFNEAGINIPYNRMDVTLLSDDTVPKICRA